MNELVNKQGNDAGLRELALFAVAGGGILGGHLLGWRTVCAVEYNAYARSVLLARQNDGTLPPFPVWDDVRTFDGQPWRGIVDVVSGGFPCQDISAAGTGAGLDGMPDMFARVRPNTYQRTAGGCDSLPESHLLQSDMCEQPRGCKAGDVFMEGAQTQEIGVRGVRLSEAASSSSLRSGSDKQRSCESPDVVQPLPRLLARYGQAAWQNGSWEDAIPRVSTGIPNRADRIKAIGNGQVSRVAATAFNILSRE